MFRERQDRDEFEQTVKLPVPGPIGMQNFEEWNISLPDSEPDPGRFGRQLVKHFPQRWQRTQLRPIFSTDVGRVTMILAKGRTRFESVG